MAKHSTSRLRAMGRGLRSTPVRAVLSLGVVLGLGAVGTLAYWTDDATLTGGTFTAGTLDVKLDGSDNNPSGFATNFALSNMQPGESKAVVVQVQNVGSLDFTYTAVGRTTGTLAPSLTFRVVPGGSVTGTGRTTTCSGTQTFSGTLTGSDQPVIATNRPVSAPPSATTTDNVCISAAIGTGVTTGQGLSTTAVFTFNAKQVNAP